jgi:hypothetical protein
MKGKMTPQAVFALKEALTVIFWKKDELQDFLKMTLTNNAIISTLNWSATKREAVKELVERLLNLPNIYSDDLINLALAVADLEDFNHLKFWDDDGTKIKRAKETVQNLRKHTQGYSYQLKEREEVDKRRREAEKRIIKNKSLNDELAALKLRFESLTIMKNVQQRGFELEKLLYDLFSLYELEPKGSFRNSGEQIDGAFTFQSTDYLLEAKWKKQVDRSEIAEFCFKVESKFKTAVGLLITIDGVTVDAVSPHFKSVIIMDGMDIITILEGRIALPDLLYKKRRKATESGEIYLNFAQL